MTRVCSTLEPYDKIHLFGKNINDLSFAFITPLGAHYDIRRHLISILQLQ
jgi:hypothetical protein